MIHHHGLTAAEKGDNNREAQSDFSRSHGDNEENEEIAIHRAVEAGKCDQSEIHSVEHELQRHVDHQRILAEDDPEKPDCKQQPGDQ